ncbi:MAG: DUF2191 domain-containing protein [Spirochaetae bacterium HGW-Spirochaetae-5]|nr:MAG: DUF2191 domain-containing protein [Spirochaetae bacterium HGW-Spirochaetae-5]
MRINIGLDDELVEEAFRCSDNITTMRELVELALKEYVMYRKRKKLKDIRGKILFREDYDYKSKRD